jgi:hypothetical protein
LERDVFWGCRQNLDRRDAIRDIWKKKAFEWNIAGGELILGPEHEVECFRLKMHMHVGKRGYQIFSSGVYPYRVFRDLDSRRLTYRDDLSAGDHDRLIAKDALSIHRHNIHMYERDGAYFRFILIVCA